MAKTIDEQAAEIVKKISDVAIELAFTRHSLTTTDYEDTDYPDIEEGVEAFKALVEEVKADVLAVLTGDDTGCLDPEDVDYDNEAEFTRRALIAVARNQQERDQAALGTVPQTVINGVGMISTKEAAAAIRDQKVGE